MIKSNYTHIKKKRIIQAPNNIYFDWGFVNTMIIYIINFWVFLDELLLSLLQRETNKKGCDRRTFR